MKLKELTHGLNILNIKGTLDIEIEGIAYDSRKVKKGWLFVCIEGYNTDGHQYIPAALENGAAALLVQKEVEAPEGIAVIHISDTRYGLASVSDVFFGHPSTCFNLVGVTGTKGKTTTTFMIKSILEEAGQKVGLVGTLGSRIGQEIIQTDRTTPESYDLQALFGEMAEKKVDSAVMEVSSQGLELHRVSCTDFDIGVFTNLSQDHISPKEHKNMEEYFQAKMKLFPLCKTALVNIDSPYGEEILTKTRCRSYTFGIEKDADIRAVDIVNHSGSVEFTIISPWGNGRILVGIPGRFTIYNALAAASASMLLGVSVDSISKGLRNISVPGRAEVIPTDSDYTVITDYAHTPDSLENILNTFRNFARGRLISLFGCGGDRDKTKRPIMGELSGRLADYTIITSDNPRTEDPESILKDIEEGMKCTKGEYIVIPDRKEAIRHALENARTGDIILLAGKGHETYQIFRDKTIHFDEREVVAEILKELR